MASSSPPTVNLLKVMKNAFGASERAVVCMVTHGQVTIDGHTLRMQWLDHWTSEQLQGRVLKCPRGEYRLVGGRLVKDLEQMRLA